MQRLMLIRSKQVYDQELADAATGGRCFIGAGQTLRVHSRGQHFSAQNDVMEAVL